MKVRVYELARKLKMKNTDLLLKLKTLNIPVSSHMSLVDVDEFNDVDFQDIPKFSFADELENKYYIDIEAVKKRYITEKGFSKKNKNSEIGNISFKINFNNIANEAIKVLYKAQLGFGFNSDLWLFDEFLDAMLNFLNNKKVYEHLFFNELLKHDFTSEKELDEFITYDTEYCISDFNRYEEETYDNYLKILLQSLFISTYSMLEYSLDKICKNVASEYEYKLKLADIAGKGITRSQKYIKKVIEIDFPDTSESWRNIKKYNDIRNVIVHFQGVILPEKLKEIEPIAKEFDGVSIVDNQIVFSHNFLRQVFKDIEWLLKDIENKVVEKFYPSK